MMQGLLATVPFGSPPRSSNSRGKMSPMMADAPMTDAVLRPLTARSVVLSLLLGAHPPEMAVRDLVALAGVFEVSEPTVRVAVTRMVSAGDLARAGSTYRLAHRLLERQHRQDDACAPRTRAHRGRWEIAVVTAGGLPAAERADLRHTLLDLRLGELREGVWLRPANLRRDWPGTLAPLVSRFLGQPDGSAADLASSLWDLGTWAGTGTTLLDAYDTAATPARQLAAAAAIVRHLLSDPVLPVELLPADWPGAALRTTYDAYRAGLDALVDAGRTT